MMKNWGPEIPYISNSNTQKEENCSFTLNNFAVTLVMITPSFVQQQYSWNITKKTIVGCYNIWANRRRSGCWLPVEKSLWDRLSNMICYTGKMTSLYWIRALGLYSLSGKTSYRKISWSLEAARFGFKLFQLLWNLAGTSAALLPRCLSNFRAIRPLQHPISRLRDFTRFGGKTSYRLVNRGPGFKPQ